MKLYEKRCVYVCVKEVSNIFKECNVNVYTFIYRIRILCFTFFNIKQIIPYRKPIFAYVKELNSILDGIAICCKADAIIEINRYKNGKEK